MIMYALAPSLGGLQPVSGTTFPVQIPNNGLVFKNAAGTVVMQLDANGNISFPNLPTAAGATGTLYNNGGLLTVSP